MKAFARYVILAPLAVGLAGPAFAQQIPPGQSCGGLLCDIGMFGHKVPVNADGTPPSPQQQQVAAAEAEAADPHRLPCHDFLCRAFGQKDADAAAPPPPPVAAVEPPPAPEPAKKVRKKKRIAKAEPAAAAPAAPAAPATPAAPK